MDAAAQVAEFARSFAAAGRPERARGEQAYLKSRLRFHGVTVPFIRAEARAFARAHPDLDRPGLLALVATLWQTDYHDLHSLAIAILGHFADGLTAADMDLVEDLLRRSHTWDHVDWLSVHIAGALIARYPATRSRLDRWARDENFWLRRAALLACLLELRTGIGDFTHFARLAAPMVAEKEFFIRKAIGWVLREAGKQRPDHTYGFLCDHIGAVAGLTLREGIKYLPVEQRDDLITRRAAHRG